MTLLFISPQITEKNPNNLREDGESRKDPLVIDLLGEEENGSILPRHISESGQRVPPAGRSIPVDKDSTYSPQKLMGTRSLASEPQ